jgi:hypothetical protein
LVLSPTDVIARLFGTLTKVQLALQKHRVESEISSPDCPARMRRNNRLADQNFRWYHRLYYRCQAEDVDGDRLLPLRIRSFDVSVNWSKYSKPWDVIVGNATAGIALFLIFEVRRDLPTQLPASAARQQDQPKPRPFRPFHDPYDENYSHSEIIVLRDGKRITKTSHISDEAKKEWRQIVSDRTRVIRPPQAA